MEILIFKTNIKFKKDLKVIELLLNKNSVIIHWNVDRQDRDHVLRVVSTADISGELVEQITRVGYFCEELPG